MLRQAFISLAVLGVCGVPIANAAAAPAKKPVRARPKTVDAAPAATLPGEEVFTRSADGMMTPNAVKLRPTTPAEAEANAVWSVRAALNIAALQCQFSPFLATVRNYNDVLRQHSDELDRARATMVAHFRRYDGAQAQNSFDRYTTQTYNSYSTLDAQYSFCERAAVAGRAALTLRKGDLGKRAAALRDDVRAGLTPVSHKALLTPIEVTGVDLPPL
ncbi:hypothetical protein [Polymorphobacter megasporae]|uniref:hypothetical protein n=2 Tax=Sphingosinicellaceae TaxID=2820280 RepID=UPI001CAA709A|nr:hypothetical protein [Polymorphobacter megasporae]UAJ08820.1 hypothetical protein KTC28_10535 [Polymorphobacter megasporae]